MFKQLSLFNQLPSEFDEKVRQTENDGMIYYSIVDACAVLSDSPHPRTYWSKLKTRILAESDETYPFWVQLKMMAPDGKMRLTDVATRKQLLRIVQSIPSPKAEPFKQWLAAKGEEALLKSEDPDYALDENVKELQGIAQQLGHDAGWIPDRLLGVQARNYLTAMIKLHFVDTDKVYGQATNATYRGLFGKDSQQIRRTLGLTKKSQKSRNYMTSLALTYIREAELICGKRLEDSEYITRAEFIGYVKVVADRIGAHVKEIEALTQMDILTGHKLLTAAESTYGE